MHHWLDYASVTTTENFVLCAVLAQGTLDADQRRLRAARAGVLPLHDRMLGARIEGVGTSHAHGARRARRLRGGEHRFDEDFHEITTFLALSAPSPAAT